MLYSLYKDKIGWRIMNVKLLICDDEKIIREGLASLDWNTRGIEVVGTAKNGEVAFELFQKMLPDIVISDIKMPQKTAYGFQNKFIKFRLIQKLYFLQDTMILNMHKVLLITAYVNIF